MSKAFEKHVRSSHQRCFVRKMFLKNFFFLQNQVLLWKYVQSVLQIKNPSSDIFEKYLVKKYN